jgi:hypothetical protein
MNIEINEWAIVVSVVFSMALGFAWYGPFFGSAWAKLAKVSEKQMKEFNPLAMLSALGTSVVLPYVLASASFLTYMNFDFSFLEASLVTAFWMFIGFQGLVMVMHDTFEGRRKKLTLINVGYELVRIAGVAFIIGMMGI